MVWRALWFALALAGLHAAAATTDTEQLKAGRAINLFSRYGYLSISMRVVPRNDTDQRWLFREPAVDVFKNVDHLTVYPRRNLSKHSSFDGDFHMEFCDNLRQLLQAYFRNFTFERLERPWRAFTGSWTPEIVARQMGINSSYVHRDYCYVLVRLSRFVESVKLVPLTSDLQLVDEVAQEIEGIEIGNVSAVLQFIKKFGSHYIASYTTGNSLYQVFVYPRSLYTKIKERLKSRGVSELSESELLHYFSPWVAEHIGQIRVASGNHTLEDWSNANLRFAHYIFTFASLLKLHRDTRLLKTLNEYLRNEAMLQIDLRTLTTAFKNPAKRVWFQEVLDNYMKLWEVNV